MKLKKEYYILFGVIFVLLVLLLGGGRRNKMSYRVPDLDRFNEEDITKIEISSAGDTIVLSGKDSSWTILPQEYKADPDKVSSMLNIVANLTLTELAAENKDYQRYELGEEKKIAVNAYNEDELVRTFDVGKVSSTYRHTFVRVGEDSRVYVARESFRSTFEVSSGDLRDKTVMTFDQNEITAILIEQEDSILHFNKTIIPAEAPSPETEEALAAQPAESQEAWQTEDGTKGSKTEIDSIVSQLADLKCDSFIEGKSKDDFSDPIYSVKITGGKNYSLLIYAKNEDEDNYPAVSSESPYAVFLPPWKAETIMKKADILVEIEEEGK
ncbi:DUF4340 domain-containing protein [Acidobacteriota bacterium]